MLGERSKSVPMKTALLIVAVPFVAFYAAIFAGMCIVAIRGRHERRNTRAVSAIRFEDFELMRN